jgi:hypothetical protein
MRNPEFAAGAFAGYSGVTRSLPGYGRVIMSCRAEYGVVGVPASSTPFSRICGESL